MTNKEFDPNLNSPEYGSQLETGVFILAGGKGTRLKKSEDLELQLKPKALVHIDSDKGSLPMLDNAISGVFESGFSAITLLTSSDPEAQGDLIESHVYERYQGAFGWIREEQPLGTAGAVFNAFNNVEVKTAAVIPADTLFPFNLLPVAMECHRYRNAFITWVVTTKPGDNAQNSGRILVNPTNGQIVYALEGNPHVDISSLLNGYIPSTSVGVVITNRDFYIELFQAFRGEENRVGAIDLYRHFIPWLLSQGVQVNTFDIGQPAPDLGTPDRLRRFGRKN